MSALELRALLTAQRWDSMSAITASKLSEERATALDYFQGDMSKYMPSIDGRSKAVSLDTSDTIEGMMPILMDVFAGGDEVVRFEPVGPEDVADAEQETDYINHIYNQVNQGFLVTYAFIKDSLLSKNGIVKVFWEKEDIKERETYYDLTDDQFAMIMAADDIELIEHTVKDYPGDEGGTAQQKMQEEQAAQLSQSMGGGGKLDQLIEELRKLNLPKRLKRDQDGKPVGLEPSDE